MHSEQIKEMIQSAAGDAGQADAHWEATGVDRLYFQDPNDPETSGAIDVQRAADGQLHVERVKLELWITPLRAAEIVALVTGAGQSVLEALSRKVGPEAARKALPVVALGYVPSNDVEAAPAAPPAVREHEAPPAGPTKLEIADAKRKLELEELVRQQIADEAEEEAREAREEAEGEPKEIAL